MLRRALYADHQIPADYELHATKFAGGRGNPSLDLTGIGRSINHVWSLSSRSERSGTRHTLRLHQPSDHLVERRRTPGGGRRGASEYYQVFIRSYVACCLGLSGGSDTPHSHATIWRAAPLPVPDRYRHGTFRRRRRHAERRRATGAPSPGYRRRTKIKFQEQVLKDTRGAVRRSSPELELIVCIHRVCAVPTGAFRAATQAAL